jgi:serine/threonine-protein kinase
LARIKINGKVGYIDPSGALKIPARFDDGGNFSEGLACAKQNSEWGYINTSGAFQIRPQFAITVCNPFHDGYAVINPGLGNLQLNRLEDHVYYIGTNGEPVISLRRTIPSIEDFSDGVAWVGTAGVQAWIIDKTGNALSGPVSVCLLPPGSFHEGLSPLQPGCSAKTGYVDMHGHFIIPPIFDEAGDFSEGVAVVKVNGKYGYIDTKGAFAIPATFDKALSFTQGLTFVKKGDKWGVIDKKGSWIVAPKFHIFNDGAEFDGELGAVGTAERTGGKCDLTLRYINHKGETVWGPSSILPVAPQGAPAAAWNQRIDKMCQMN